MTGNAEIVIPRLQDEQRLAALKQLEMELAVLIDQAQSIVVKDQISYALAAGVRTSFKSYLDAVKYQTGPGITEAKERLDRLKQQEAMFLNPGKDGLQQLDDKILAFREEEKRQAKVEQDRKNAELARQAREKAEAERKVAEAEAAERRKQAAKDAEAARRAGEIGKREAERLKKEALEAEARERAKAQSDAAAAAANPATVTVKPNIPTVAGAPKNQTFYGADVLDGQLILIAFMNAVKSAHVERATFLSKFICVNDSEVSKFARDTKDVDKATEAFPKDSVRFWSKG